MANPITQRLDQNKQSPIMPQNTNQQMKLSEIYKMIQNSGKTPKDLFYSMCAAKGVDPNVIINQVKSQI